MLAPALRLTRLLAAAGASAILAVGLAPVSGNAASAGSPGPQVLTPAASSTSRGPLRDAPAAATSSKPAHQQAGVKAAGSKPGSNRPRPGGGGGDGALQSSVNSSLAPPTKGASFAGVGSPNGSYASSPCSCAPSDDNLSVGATQVVQFVNTDVGVFSKSGVEAAGFPKPGNWVFSGLNDGCASNNDGDPIVKYDVVAGRWILTQFSVSTTPYLQCIAISDSADATGTYHTWAYSFGSSNFNDYPKLGIWPDSSYNAYLMSFNIFLNGRTFSGPDACAIDRASMLSGLASPAMVCFQQSSGYGTLLPSDFDGNPALTGSTQLPPAGSPGYFADFGSNSLSLWSIKPNFANPSASTLSGPSALATAAFSEACSGGTCVAQSGSSQKLDSLGDRLMYRLAYRNFGTSQSMVVTHSVTGSGTAAPRWYELSKTASSSSSWSIRQQSSYAPDSTYRWMGSVAEDRLGDMALGYSVSSTSINPGIRYTGRLAGDSLNQMRPEGTILAGTGAQNGGLNRWGDYTSMAVDPSDDCTFWYTNQYLKATSSFNWSTWIASVRFPGC